MADQHINPLAVAVRAAEIVGGRHLLLKSMEDDFNEMKARWNKDVNTIGRILRAHLHVEHYLTEYLRHINPAIGHLDSARLTFNQKVSLLPSDNGVVNMLIGGIRHLNKVRNRVAHNLEAAVTEEDATVFRAQPLDAMREWSVKGTDRAQSTDPLDILKWFAEYASSSLHTPGSITGRAFSQAMQELSVQAAAEAREPRP